MAPKMKPGQLASKRRSPVQNRGTMPHKPKVEYRRAKEKAEAVKIVLDTAGIF
jgi:hypothetical protein